VYLAEEAVNMRSIFIKPVPFDMTEDRLKAIFEEVGDVAPNGVRLNMDARKSLR
jgi:RNA recognition motif-containing protein